MEGIMQKPKSTIPGLLRAPQQPPGPVSLLLLVVRKAMLGMEKLVI
jgi:hypothetical protein